MKQDTDGDPLATQAMPTAPVPRSSESPTGRGEEKAGVRANDSSSGRLEVRCPNCHAPTEVAVDTSLTDLTCESCGSHFSLVDQSKATRMAPSLSKLGRFELIERIGIGGFGSVWKARDKELDRTVAIKIPRQTAMTGEEQEKFFREARAAAQLKHPNIVSVHEVGRDGDSVYIVSDFVRGVTLGDWLTGQKLTSREAAELCAKIAEALHHAHEQGVVHRDLKPSNIMMDYDGQPHLMDFGLARRESGEVSITMDGQVIGTPAYMSPEQAQGEGHTADRRTDVYSLGVILFQLLTGELPFRGNARMLIKQVVHDEPPSPRKLNGNVPKDLETITIKCLEKEPNRRYQTACQLSDELKHYLAGKPIDARPIGRLNRAWRWCRRNRAVASLTATVATILLLATAFSTRQATVARRAEQLAESRMQAEQRARREAIAISDLLEQMLQSANPDAAKGADYTVRQMLDEFSAGLADQLHDQPTAEAAIRATIGRAYRRLSLSDKAEPHLKAALALRMRELGPNSKEVAQSLVDSAWNHFERNEQAAAEGLARQALTIHRNLGLQNAETVEIIALLQLALLHQSKYNDAEAAANEALAIAQELPQQPPVTADILHRLADGFNALGDFGKAECIARKALDAHRKLHGPNHPETAWGLYTLARILEAEEKFTEAEPYCREALAIFREQYDENDKNVQLSRQLLEGLLNGIRNQSAKSVRALATAYKAAGKTDEAVHLCLEHDLYADALRLALGGSDELLGQIMEAARTREIELQPLGGELRLVAGDPPGAEAAMRAAIAQGQTALFMYKSLGWCLLTQGKSDEARESFAKALEARRQTDGTYNLDKADPDELTAAYFLDLIPEEQYIERVGGVKKFASFPWFYVAERRKIEGDNEAAAAAYERSVKLGKGDNAHYVSALARWRLMKLGEQAGQ